MPTDSLTAPEPAAVTTARRALASRLDRRYLPVIGSVLPGEGVGLLRAGEPYELSGWEHFLDQK